MFICESFSKKLNQNLTLSFNLDFLMWSVLYCTCRVDGDSIDAPVLRLQLLKENTHRVAQGFEGELAAFSSGRQTYRDHRQAVLIHHCNVCRHMIEEMPIRCVETKLRRIFM